MSDFEREIKECFLEEAAQMLAETEQCFLALEAKPDDAETIDQLFRLAHNLKGSGNAVGFTDLGTFTHRLESLLLKVKNREIQVTKPVMDLLLKSNDHLQTWVQKLRVDLTANVDSSALIGQLEAQVSGNIASLTTTNPVIQAEPTQNIYPSAAAFAETADDETAASTTNHSESSAALEQPQLRADTHTAPVQVNETPTPANHLHKSAPPKAADESLRVSLARLDKLLNGVSELVILHSVLKEQSTNFNPAILRKTILQLGKATREVQDISMSLRMVPIKQVFQKMQRIVRDTSAALGKTIILHTEGEDTEVDKNILESLSDPLVHLIRNGVDHGIESMEKRLDAGKDAEGNITLRAFHQSGNLIVEIRDDGGGLDAARLQKRAIEKGILPANANLSEKDAHQLIFAPGFSTKTEVTDISGRGVGMDVVKTNITALQGSIQIQTELGRGTCFTITLPLTLAVIDGMIVKSGAGRFVVPLSHVYETIKPAEVDVHFVTGMGDVFSLRGENLPLYHLDNLLSRKARNVATERSTTIVVRGQRQSFAVMVDEIVGQAQVVIKQLGLEHKSLRGFSGSAILGDGRPALILELEDLSLRAKATGSQLNTLRSVS